MKCCGVCKNLCICPYDDHEDIGWCRKHNEFCITTDHICNEGYERHPHCVIDNDGYVYWSEEPMQDSDDDDDEDRYMTYRQYLKQEFLEDFEGWPWYKVVAYFGGITLIVVGGWFTFVMLFAAFG